MIYCSEKGDWTLNILAGVLADDKAVLEELKRQIADGGRGIMGGRLCNAVCVMLFFVWSDCFFGVGWVFWVSGVLFGDGWFRFAGWAVLVPDCIVHCCSLILVEKKAVDSCFHKHKKWISTWSHAGRVVKNSLCTPYQA
jgi:hypothetical protein